MADGSLPPNDIVYPTNGNIWWGWHIGSTNSRYWGGNRCVASLGADSVLTLRFEAPQSGNMPSGTAKLRVISIANATSGNAIINPSWASVAVTENYDTTTLNAEGNTTITWSTGDNDDVKETLITLDADTIVADEFIYMHITFVTASWTLAQISTWNFSIIWE